MQKSSLKSALVVILDRHFPDKIRGWGDNTPPSVVTLASLRQGTLQPFGPATQELASTANARTR